MRRTNGRLRRNVARRQGVALQAQQVHLAYLEQARIGRSVRHMTGGATLGFHRQVLIDKGTPLVGVALEADLVQVGTGSELMELFRAMGIVTIAADEKPLVDAMPERTAELCLLHGVAAVAQRGLAVLQEAANDLGVVG